MVEYRASDKRPQLFGPLEDRISRVTYTERPTVLVGLLKFTIQYVGIINEVSLQSS